MGETLARPLRGRAMRAGGSQRCVPIRHDGRIPNMCSNYRPARRAELAHFGVAPPELPLEDKDAYPGSAAPMIYQPPEGGGWSCVAGTFGLLPIWAKERALAKRTYNARVETVAEKPSFRSAWHKRQVCIVPAAAIYEPCYETGKAVWWRIARADGAPMAIAGLWERKSWEAGVPSWSFTLLTVNAETHPLMRRFHKPDDEKRTVVVLDGDAPEAWLAAESKADLRALLRPCAETLLVAAPGRL
uniref:Abasic site processing protein n=2 Tax=Aromatoleum buckelii TaxID=200254 RepID=A0ABX1N832_9RHOO